MSVREMLMNRVLGNGGTGAASSDATPGEAPQLPPFIANILSKYGIDAEQIQEGIKGIKEGVPQMLAMVTEMRDTLVRIEAKAIMTEIRMAHIETILGLQTPDAPQEDEPEVSSPTNFVNADLQTRLSKMRCESAVDSITFDDRLRASIKKESLPSAVLMCGCLDTCGGHPADDLGA